MNKILTSGVTAIISIVGTLGVDASGAVERLPSAPPIASELKTAADFKNIRNPEERSLALFAEMGKVLQHPRCMNCHPADDRPLQTDARRLHIPHVVRGEAGIGAPGQYCTACHRMENYDQANVPGNPIWHLAPAEIAWVGKSLGEICEQIKDPARNGGKSMEELVHHLADDELVGWGWNPGGDRTPVPGTQRQFGELATAWAGTGAHCPDRAE